MHVFTTIKRYQPPKSRISWAKLGGERNRPGITPKRATITEITEVTPPCRGLTVTVGQAKKVQRFSLRYVFRAISN